MSAVPFYAVDTSKRSFECSRYNKNSLAVPKTENTRSSSLNDLPQTCHQEVKRRPSSTMSNFRHAFDSFTY